ncbi:DUF3604 domain-containing protein [Desulfosediminicola ganghwensis]|uniref:DUF3604 domain-containing protein n=1 Tax=Desulfosediminicola ganghwensis TaxID=2569540 RepID=UPI0010AC72A5|nr:DUF3604 domain-containing protein [Desulfosediminicola ganghwensis]
MKGVSANWYCIVLSAILIGGVTSAYATTSAMFDKENTRLEKKEFSPYVNRAYPTQVFFGDTHLHTSLSMDAGTFGNRLGLDEAYRFVRGGEVVASGGFKARLAEPLDFVVIADHSDGMGFFDMFAKGDPAMMNKEEGKRWHKAINEGGQAAVDAALEIITLFSQGKFPWKTNDPKIMKPVWQNVIDAAEQYNEPGRFTAFIGYEWTSLVKGNNLHRVVVYRDGSAQARQTLPFTLADSADPEKLWDAMQSYEDRTGGDLLAIPHNGNLSNGLMFDVETLSGKPLDRDYAELRQKWEPLYETTQIKGDGEAHPFLSPDDEFADYETWDLGNLDMSQAKTEEMLAGEYIRSGLKRGLEFDQQLGVNPYKYGQIGSTDSHTSLPAVEENNFFGKHSGVEPSPERAMHVTLGGEYGKIMGYQMAASGYAGVWATSNTRQAIFDAMARRETYATTGPRLVVRFFGGWDFTEQDALSRMPAHVGYQKGVPMGGDLSMTPDGKSPTFLVAALKDSMSGNLDRIQIIKGWLGSDGKAQERVYDVAVSDGREIGEDGRCRTPVGNTVNVAEATWTNTIGDPELITVWTDPDFDPAQRAFYYARVLEIPTPRWTAYEAKRFEITMPPEAEMITQERAYTSPIWYTP